jgi:predicted membrane protein
MDFENLLLQLGAWFIGLWTLGGVKAIVAQTLANVVLAVATALYTDNFNLKKLAEFLYRKLLPYVLVYVVVYAVGDAADMAWLAPVVYATIVATLAGDMLENLMALGLKLPQAFNRLVREEESTVTVYNLNVDADSDGEIIAAVEHTCSGEENCKCTK